MAAVKVTKRPGRKHYYARIDGRYVSTGHTDQRIAVQAATRMATVGVEAFRQGKRTLSENLSDLVENHLDHLINDEGRGGPEHIRKKRIHLMKPVEAGVFRKLKDIQKKPFMSWLDSLACGPKTRNEYQTSWNVFFDWLVYEDRIDQNPIKGRIRRARVRPEDRTPRRDLTLEDLRRLSSVAPKRELLYLTAATTGARFNELKQLHWSQVHEAGPDPFIALLARTTKNKKARDQFITRELAGLLAEARVKARGDRVFPKMPSHHTINKDLETAGIPKMTDDGVACFHSLRHAFTTIIARETQDPRIAQRLADHADISTTQKYMHTEATERADVMRRFPSLRATGRATGVVQSGLFVSDEGATSPSFSGIQVSEKETLSPDVSEPFVRCPSMEPGGIEPYQNRPWRTRQTVRAQKSAQMGRTHSGVNCRKRGPR